MTLAMTSVATSPACTLRARLANTKRVAARCRHALPTMFKPDHCFPSKVSASATASHRCRQMIVRAEQKGKGVGRGGYPIDEEKSKQLKLVADKMDAFFAHNDEAAFDAVASTDITLHGDLLILDNDLSGADRVKQTLGLYTKAYDYKHENIAHGADIDGGSVFHFWLHQDLKKKEGGGDGKAEELTDGTATKAALWRYVVGDNGKVTDIYFLTQLTPDEKLSMFTDPKLGSDLKFDVMDFKGPTIEPEDNRMSSMLDSAKIFSEIWETGNSSLADNILSKNFKEIAPIFGSKIEGPEKFKSTIDGLFSNYTRTGGMSAFAVDPDSNKAFIHWESKGKMSGDGPDGISLYGLNMLIFDSYGLVETVVGFRQPLPNERVKYMKKVPEKAGAAV
ncbi:TPA: hypothetical protein ACH3X2_011238 [Trebouxia sp. C0005]